jgi:hypothetical protein
LPGSVSVSWWFFAWLAGNQAFFKFINTAATNPAANNKPFIGWALMVNCLIYQIHLFKYLLLGTKNRFAKLVKRY